MVLKKVELVPIDDIKIGGSFQPETVQTPSVNKINENILAAIEEIVERVLSKKPVSKTIKPKVAPPEAKIKGQKAKKIRKPLWFY